MSGAHNEKLMFLRQVHWLRSLDWEELSRVASLLKEESQPPGTFMIRQGEEGRRFYILREGNAQVILEVDNGERVLDNVTPGDNFGEASLVSGQPCSASVVAVTPCRLFYMESDDFQLALAQSHTFARALLGNLSARLVSQAGSRYSPEVLPQTVVTVAGVSVDLRGTLAWTLARLLGEVQGSEVPVVWDLGDPPPWVGALRPAMDPSATLGSLQEQRFVVVVTDDVAWDADTDVVVDVDRPVAARGSRGRRGVQILPGEPPADVDWSGSVRIDDIASLVALARAGGQLSSLRKQLRQQLTRLTRVVTGRRVGVALGGGGAWGLSHIGVLRALHALEIPVDLVAGTSAGALVGAAWCGGGTSGLDLLEQRFTLSPSSLNFLLRGAVEGFVSQERAVRWMNGFLPIHEFRQVQTPFFGVSYNIARGEEVVLERGSLSQAVACSNALPLVLPPMARGTDLLIDGMFCNNVPTSVVYSRGADFIIGVDVVPRVIVSRGDRFLQRLPGLGRIDALMAATYGLVHQSTRSHTWVADVVMEPDLGDVGWYQFWRAREIIEKGEAWTLAHGRQLQESFQQFGKVA